MKEIWFLIDSMSVSDYIGNERVYITHTETLKAIESGEERIFTTQVSDDIRSRVPDTYTIHVCRNGGMFTAMGSDENKE